MTGVIYTRLITRTTVMTMSATHEDKNHIRAELCNSGFLENNLMSTILTAVQVPPAVGAGYHWIRR